MRARCCMPPESWKGKDESRSAEIPTASKSSADLVNASFSANEGSWARWTSMNCSDSLRMGLRQAIADCMTTAILVHRYGLRSASDRVARSVTLPLRSWKRIWPALVAAGIRCRRPSALSRVDFPHADSPATPRISPRRRRKLTLSQARMFPDSVT